LAFFFPIIPNIPKWYIKTLALGRKPFESSLSEGAGRGQKLGQREEEVCELVSLVIAQKPFLDS
jgi:hypothetical protein